MRKIRKLFRSPKLFFKDAVLNRFPSIRYRQTFKEIIASHQQERPTAILVGFSDWKLWMADVLCEYNVIFLGHSPKVSLDLLELIPKFYEPSVFVWSYKCPQHIQGICSRNGISLTFVEDGFLRSMGLGIDRSRPLSLVFDNQAMHFDSKGSSELDHILNSHNFGEDQTTSDTAKKLADILSAGATKYMRAESGESLRGELSLSNDEHVVLVLGQVEDDLSIKFGASRFFSGTDLVKLAAIENPLSRILYRPHPEALVRNKKHYSNPEDVQDISDIIGLKWSLHESIELADRVYTVTSFSGFEAVLRGKDVDLFGLPFYGGWGFTNDRHSIDMSEKRRRELTPLEVLAGALVIYPKYFHPVTSEAITAEQAVSIVQSFLNRLRAKSNRLKSPVGLGVLGDKFENFHFNDKKSIGASGFTETIDGLRLQLQLLTEFSNFIRAKIKKESE